MQIDSPIPIPDKYRDLPAPERPGYDWASIGPMAIIHLLPLGALWTGARWQDWAMCFALYFGRMFFVTGWYHRYFSHRTFKTSRIVQFIAAFLTQTASQRGVLWWAAHHRNHHKFSDLPWDTHSPIQRGFWFSHVGWIYEKNAGHTDYNKIRDLAKYPELRWLDKYWYVPPTVLGVLTTLTMGWSGLFIAFALSTTLLWHGTFTINSLAHVFGKRRFATTDTSRNNWLLALITLGEGWHNNHHHYMGSTRQGFYWWELDITYYILKAMSWVGLVWDLRPVPETILAEGRRKGTDAAAPPATTETDLRDALDAALPDQA
ncbi:acyl-CoA desaturase [Nannocystis sp. SCPEA4]|uniref:acyl-CoA desaturase n=1 Tax=Nannocystis sp. SCPEA4 TaxID=2996787 RepID=UPI00226DF753|nr:acyl-CoA desaturase [Nannocystis sp. SCPEA4]MCY1057150.1 acyl-CoA desaturase [Nannocystis sp. SCPEA4]